MPKLNSTPLTDSQIKSISLVSQEASLYLVRMAEPLRLASETLVKSFSSGLSLQVKTITEQLRRITPPLFTDIFPQVSYFPQIMDIGDEEIMTTKPQRIAKRKKKNAEFHIYDEKFSIGITAEGTFYYRNRLISHVSISSKHGKLFKLLIEAENNYVDDVTLLKILCPQDPDKGLGYIREDLIRYLAKDHLEINIYRNRKQGYKLRKITKARN